MEKITPANVPFGVSAETRTSNENSSESRASNPLKVTELLLRVVHPFIGEKLI